MSQILSMPNQLQGRAANNCTGSWTCGGFSGFRWEGAVSRSYRMGGSDFSTDLDSGRGPESRSCERSQPPNLVRSQQSWTSPASSRRSDAREDALRPCLTCRTLLPTTLADTDVTCSRCLTLRGEGTRRVTTIPEISPLAQSFLSAVRLQCSGVMRYLSNAHSLSLCKILIPSV